MSRGFRELIINKKSKKQIQCIYKQAKMYLGGEYNNISKKLIIQCFEESQNLKIDADEIYELLNDNTIDLNRDKEFIIYIIKNKFSEDIAFKINLYIEQTFMKNKDKYDITTYIEITLMLAENIRKHYGCKGDRKYVNRWVEVFESFGQIITKSLCRSLIENMIELYEQLLLNNLKNREEKYLDCIDYLYELSIRTR